MVATEEDKDPLLQQIINSANKGVESYCHRIFDEATLVDEEYDGTDSTILYLKRIPITAVSAVKYGYPTTIALVTVDSSWYGFGADYIYTDGRSGLIFELRPKYWKISFTGGYKQTQMPSDLILVTCELADLVYKDQQGRLGVTTRSMGGEVVESFIRQLSPMSQTLLDSYKRIAV